MQKYENVGNVEQTSSTTWKWTIKNYRTYLEERQSLVLSPEIPITKINIGTTNWRFKLHPKSFNNENKISLYITNLNKEDVTVEFQFEILDRFKNIMYTCPKFSKCTFSRRTNTKTQGYEEYVSYDLLSDNARGTLVEDVLVIQCRISVGQIDVPNNTDNRLFMPYFETLFESGKHSDVTFTIGEKQAHFHKAIISSRSPVFQAMFEHDMPENQQNTVEITDITWEVMKEMCRYMYAGKVNEIDSISKDLLIAADKYCIEGLKDLCEKSMCDQLNIDNALEYLQLAKTYNTGLLKPKVYEFVKNNIKHLHLTPQFDELDAETAKEIIRILIGATNGK